MPLSLTCDCGARFDVEDALAGQSVSCPECQQPLKAPSAQRPSLRTSGFALASFLLAVVGAFTVVGTIAAVVLGVIAVVAILRDRERVAGLGFAAFGIGLGLVFTTLTLWSLTTGELFGLGAGMRRFQMADQLEPIDPKAPLEIAENGFSLTRPSAKWARAKKDFQYLVVQPLLRKDALLLLVQPDLFAFVDVQVDTDPHFTSLQEYVLSQLKQDLAEAVPGKDKPNNGPKLPPDEDEVPQQQLPRVDTPILKYGPKMLPQIDGVREVSESLVEVPLDGKHWSVLLRTYQTAGGKVFIVRAFAETPRFERVKEDLVKALDSFRLTPAP